MVRKYCLRRKVPKAPPQNAGSQRGIWVPTKPILEKMMKMTGEEKRRITRYAKVNPGAPVDQILKGSQDLRAQIKIFVDLTNDVREALIKAQNSLNMEEGEIAAEAIERWLHDKGFIE